MKTLHTPRSKPRPKQKVARSKRRQFQVACGDRVLQAYNKAVKHLVGDETLTATEQSAGFLFPAGEDENGYQVFVRVARFNHALLKQHPQTGGLLANVS